MHTKGLYGDGPNGSAGEAKNYQEMLSRMEEERFMEDTNWQRLQMRANLRESREEARGAEQLADVVDVDLCRLGATE